MALTVICLSRPVLHLAECKSGFMEKPLISWGFEMSKIIYPLSVCGLLLLAQVSEAQVFRNRQNNNQYRPNNYQPGQNQAASATQPQNTQPQNTQPQNLTQPNQAGTPAAAQTNPISQSQPIVTTQTNGSPNLRLHWSQMLLEGVTKDHDFGAVAKASSQRHVFEFKNVLDTDLHLTGVRASCGCTKPRVLTSVVKPGEMGQIEAVFDTHAFTGNRSATLTVGVNKNQPYSDYSELRFSVKGLIRTDVVFDPGMVDFGSVVKGNQAERSLILKYAGNPDWKVENVVASNPGIDVDFKEVMRDRNRGRIDYQVNLKLKSSEMNGSFNDLLTIQTSEGGAAKLTMSVKGSVDSLISASDLQIGMVQKGKSVEKKLVITGKEPFEIDSVSCPDARVEFPTPISTGAKTLHIVNLKFQAANEGLVNDEITIRTKNPNQPIVKIAFRGQVIPETFATNPNANK
jgi:Protein of unknown function (DUF1573)